MPVAAHSAPAKRHLFWVDWVRFLAAFFVLLDHACQMNWSGPEVAVDPGSRFLLRFLVSPIHLGREAVVVFFVLSGALVGGLTLEKIRAGTFDARMYAADRIARIYVPLIPALLLCAAVLRGFDLPVHPLQLAGCLFGVQGVLTRLPRIDGVLWSLAYEVWFYVLAGCAAVVATRQNRPLAARLTALAGVALSLWILCFRLEWINLVCWLVGAGGFGWRHRIAPAARPWIALAGIVVAVVSFTAVWTDFLPLLPAHWTISQQPWRFELAHFTLSLGTLMFIVGVCQSAPKTRLGAWIERLGTPQAAFSYTLYLTHYPLLLALMWLGGELPGIVTVTSLVRLGWWMGFCVAVAVGMYALFERQTPGVRGWLRTRLGGTVPRAQGDAPGRPALAAGI